jgi:hypothetical protein
LIATLTLIPSLAFGQITADYISPNVATDVITSTLNVPVSIGSGNNRFLIVMIGQYEQMNPPYQNLTQVSRGTGGERRSFTHLRSADITVRHESTNNFYKTSIWYLQNPFENNDSIHIDTTTINTRLSAAAFSFQGVNSSSLGIVGLGSSGISNTINTSITPATIEPNSWVLNIGLSSTSTSQLVATGSGHYTYPGLEASNDMRLNFGRVQNVSSTATLGWTTRTSDFNMMAMSSISFAPAPVPEPATIGLVGVAGLAAIRLIRKRTNKNKVTV